MTVSQKGADTIRITKKPEERRQELIQIAEQLFIQKGYETTAVSDIVKQANVAQGTFYYYFKTKENILDAIIDRYITLTVNGMERIANKQGVTATEKLINIFLFSSSFRNNRKSLLQYLHEDKNAHLHLKFERKIPTKTIQPLSKIIIQGIHEKTFTTPYPEEAAKAFIGITALVLQGIYHIQPGSTDFIRKFNATFDFLEKILGAQPHTLLNMYQLKGGHYL